MKRKWIIVGLSIIVLSACTAENHDVKKTETLRVSDGVDGIDYSVSDLQNMDQKEVEFAGEPYLGVVLADLLVSAGHQLNSIKSVKAVAADGYSVYYGFAQYSREDVLVAYAKPGGTLAEDDGLFRMVLPGEEGKLNLRMLVELVVENE